MKRIGKMPAYTGVCVKGPWDGKQLSHATNTLIVYPKTILVNKTSLGNEVYVNVRGSLDEILGSYEFTDSAWLWYDYIKEEDNEATV
jgi:hypothetical protein